MNDRARKHLHDPPDDQAVPRILPIPPATSIYGSRLVALALAVILGATLSVAAYVYGGAPWGLTVLTASLVAVTGWLTTTFRRPASAPAAFPMYIVTVTALLVLDAEEWRYRMPSRLIQLFPSAFPTGVGIAEHAFVAIFPLAGSTVLVLGALTYYHGSAIGRFAAWFTFAWTAVASLSVYIFVLVADAPPGYLGGMIAAPFNLALALAGMYTLSSREGKHATRGIHAAADTASATPTAIRTMTESLPSYTAPPMNRETRLSIALVAVFIPTYGTLLYLHAGLMVVGIVCGSMVAGLVAWLRTTARRPPRASAILPAYLLALVLFLVHVLEEYVYDFSGRIAGALDVRWTEAQFIEVIALLGPAIWIAGAIGIYKRHPIGNYLAWFFFIGMIVGEPTHMLLFPFVEGGRYHYFPGMWSALFSMVPAVYGIWRMVSDDRVARGHPFPATPGLVHVRQRPLSS